jgi:two-component system, NtrC family, sensor kinase
LRSSQGPLLFSWWAVSSLLLIVLILLGGMIFRNFEQLETMRGHVIYAHRLQAVAADIQAALTDFFLAENREDPKAQLDRLTGEIIDLTRNDLHVAPETPKKLEALRHSIDLLTHTQGNDEQRETLLLEALSYTNTIMDIESLHREVLLEDISHATRTEIGLVFATVIALLVLIGVFIRYRILTPLRDLQKLLLRLAQEDFSPIETRKIDPMLRPIFGSYNLMVEHLAELEEGKRLYALSLEAEVRHAAATLLEQQAGLSRNERLAAVGELAAGIAHELRNPLAGIQMSCANLRKDFEDPDMVERMSLVIEELKRMGRLLNELLDLSKHTPAPVDAFDLPELIRELVALLRYQIPERIDLILDLPASLACRLPSSRIRQCLLNLILNAAEAIGPNSGTIRIVVEAQDLDRITVTVDDDGPGFSEEVLQNGIRPFSTGKASGTGLGLAMVQRFVRELGGQLHLGRNTPHGAIVRLNLPRQNA